jgi:hypothetical protein
VSNKRQNEAERDKKEIESGIRKIHYGEKKKLYKE